MVPSVIGSQGYRTVHRHVPFVVPFDVMSRAIVRSRDVDRLVDRDVVRRCSTGRCIHQIVATDGQGIKEPLGNG